MEATDAVPLDYLPMVLLTQILSILPVKSLLILRSVSKFFLAIINSSSFVSLHIRNFPPNHNQTRILTLQPDHTEIWEYEQGLRDLDDVSYHGGCELLDVGPPTHSEKWIERDSFFDCSSWFVAGSVDGLILLADYDEAKLWNPSIGKFRRIPNPSPSNPLHYNDSIRIGLGYDISCDDYKVLALMNDDTWRHYATVKAMQAAAVCYVYSVRTKSWVKGELPECRDRRALSQSVSFKGGLVWIEGVQSSDGYYHRLARFDFATNSFAYSWMPYPIKNNLWIESRLVMIDGGSSLGVWGLDPGNLVSLWAMDETAKSSWIRLYSFGQGVWRVGGFLNTEMTWEYWTKGARPKVSLYDDNQDEDSRYPPYCHYMGGYVESLALLN